MDATPLDESHTAIARDFLFADPVANVFLIGIMERWGLGPAQTGSWWGCFGSKGDLHALVYAGPADQCGRASIAVASGAPESCVVLGNALHQRGGASWVIGEQAPSDALWLGLGDPPARVHSNQTLMCATRATPGQTLELREAQPSDLVWVLGAASAMLKEDLGISKPQVLPPHVAIAGECVGLHGGERVFRAKLATSCSAGAQIGGIWVDPLHRHLGLGRAGTRGMVQSLLETHGRVTLHVRTDNLKAIRCYESVGFAPVRAFRVMVR